MFCPNMMLQVSPVVIGMTTQPADNLLYFLTCWSIFTLPLVILEISAMGEFCVTMRAHKLSLFMTLFVLIQLSQRHVSLVALVALKGWTSAGDPFVILQSSSISEKCVAHITLVVSLVQVPLFHVLSQCLDVLASFATDSAILGTWSYPSKNILYPWLLIVFAWVHNHVLQNVQMKMVSLEKWLHNLILGRTFSGCLLRRCGS